MGTSIQGSAGERLVGDATESELRLDRNSNLAVTGAHGTYAEASRRGRVFVASTALAGIASATAHLSPVAATAATLLSLYNPINSGVELSILRVTGDFISATVEVGSYTWNFHGYANVSAAQSTALTRCCRISGSASPDASKARAFSGQTITGGVLALQGPAIGMWAVAGVQRFDEFIDGRITVPQGCMVTIGAPTNDNASIVSSWALWYEELAIITS